MTSPKAGADLGRVRGIDRAIELLECLHAARQPLRIGEIARRLNAPRSTVYELVNRFLDAAILEAYDADGRVFFGRTLHFYAADFLEIHGLSRRAREEVVSIAERTGETAQFCVLHGDKYTVAHMQTGRKIFRISTEIGVRVPIPWTASGRLLLDHMTREEVEQFVPAEDFVLPNGARINPERFYDELCRARRDGYCVTTGLVDDSTNCIAAPVRRTDGVAVAGVCVVTVGRLSESEKRSLVCVLQESAARLSSYVTGSVGPGLGGEQVSRVRARVIPAA
jgi:DNA-binding IclR family transcriptional regulator